MESKKHVSHWLTRFAGIKVLGSSLPFKHWSVKLHSRINKLELEQLLHYFEPHAQF